MPFDMDDPMLIVKLLTCRFEFHQDSWGNITNDAKDLIKKMLSTPYKDRITAKEILNHSWFKKQRRRPSVRNLGATLIRLKELNDEREKKRYIMREYFFNNVFSARNKMTQMIASGAANSVIFVSQGLRRIASRGSMSSYSAFSENSSKSKNGKIQLKHTKPKNRQELLQDIRQRHGHSSHGSDEDDDTNSPPSTRPRSQTSFIQRFNSQSSAMVKRIASGRRKKKVPKQKEPKNIQALLTDIRTRKAAQQKKQAQRSRRSPSKLEDSPQSPRSPSVQMQRVPSL